jgi:hypothetical protein
VAAEHYDDGLLLQNAKSWQAINLRLRHDARFLVDSDSRFKSG